jgi:hypothetical protein
MNMPPSAEFLRQLSAAPIPFSSSVQTTAPTTRGKVLYTDPSGRFRFYFAGLKGSGSASFLHYAIDDLEPGASAGNNGRPMTYSVYVRLKSEPRPDEERVRTAVVRAFRDLGNLFTVDIDV